METNVCPEGRWVEVCNDGVYKWANYKHNKAASEPTSKLRQTHVQLCKLASETCVWATDISTVPRFSFKKLLTHDTMQLVIASSPSFYASHLYFDKTSVRRLRENLMCIYKTVLTRLHLLHQRSMVALAISTWKHQMQLKGSKHIVMERKSCSQYKVQSEPHNLFTKHLMNAVNCWYRCARFKLQQYWYRWKAEVPMKKKIRCCLGKFFVKWNWFYVRHKLARLTADRFLVVLSPVIKNAVRSKLQRRWAHWKWVNCMISRRVVLWRSWRNWKAYLFNTARHKNVLRLRRGLDSLKWFKERCRLYYWKLSSRIRLFSTRRLLSKTLRSWMQHKRINLLVKHMMKCCNIGSLLYGWIRWKEYMQMQPKQRAIRLSIDVVADKLLQYAASASAQNTARYSSIDSRSPAGGGGAGHGGFNPQLNMSLTSIASNVSFHNWNGQEVKHFPDPFPNAAMVVPRSGERSPRIAANNKEGNGGDIKIGNPKPSSKSRTPATSSKYSKLESATKRHWR